MQINYLKKFISRYSKIFYILYVLLFIEFISASGLIILVATTKIISPDPQKRKAILFNKNDFPHPILSINKLKLKIQNNNMAFVSDPNFGYYLPKLRFGEDRKWLTNPESLKKNVNIFMFGGSTIEGDGAKSQENTVASQLEKLLNENRSDECYPIKVFNEGISGYQAKQQFNLLFNAVLPRVRKDIDMVVTVDGVNDFLSYVSLRKKIKSPFNETLSTRELEMTSIGQEFLEKQSVNSRSDFLLNISKNTFLGKLSLSLQRLTSKSAQNNLQDLCGHKADLSKIQFKIKERSDNYIYYIELEKKLLDSLNIENFRFIQPYISYKKNLSDEEIKIRNKLAIYPRVFWDSFDRYYSQVISDLPNYQNVIDISNLFSENKEQLFVDNVHYNPEGQLIIASEIRKNIYKFLPCKKQ